MATTKKTLVIVESPSKAKTIGKYLGSKYKVMASVGHVRDLPKSKIGIDMEDNFEPQYINIRGKGDLIKELKKEAKKASNVLLATDPDREGEAISWHLAYILGIDLSQPCRVVFNEITKNKVKEAIKHPRIIEEGLVDAQQARRVLDRLVGYQISPLLWRKIKKGLSAGRVQSAALKIICDREKEIKAFVPEEYWNIYADFKKNKKFTAKVALFKNEKLKISNKKEADEILKAIEKNPYTVEDILTKERARKPLAPFTTSSLQQDAGNKLNFSTKKTMQIAQQLYEGVEIKGQGTVGLITYLRTDSVRISEEAKLAAKDYILENYGTEYYSNNVFTNKKKDIQDAHEAIRPSIIHLSPETIEQSLTKDQFKLYNLIWRRFIASQMSSAKYLSVQGTLKNGDYTFKTSGSQMLFDGFQKLYIISDDKGEKTLPPLQVGEKLMAVEERGEQSFTQPPSRYTEASLVRELEDKNIGRPSTYAPIVSTLTQRKYVGKEKKYLLPTELGFLVTDLMENYFTDIVDANFTAQMEDNLDDIELGKVNWKSVVETFYTPFSKELQKADEAIEKVVVEDVPTGEMCQVCGKPMVIKNGRFGDFIACSGYPECKNTKPIVNKIGVKCPDCGKDIIVRRGRSGKTFYGCSGYPKCSRSYWNKPVNKVCPKCSSLLVEKKTKGSEYSCSNTKCDYKE